MTAVVLSIALLVTPAPIHPRQELTPWQTLKPTASVAVYVPATSPSFFEMFDRPAENLFPTDGGSAEIAKPAPTESPTEKPPEPPIPPPPEPPPTPPAILSAIEQGLNRLSELGANDWQLRTFGCIAWFESGNNPNAWNAVSHDDGLWQLNERYHAWRWAGRDIFDPIVNAEIAWDVYRESGFRAWVVHGACGV